MIVGIYKYNVKVSNYLDNMIKASGAFLVSYKLQKNCIGLAKIQFLSQEHVFTRKFHQEGNCYIVSNARIDNREDLGRKLQMDRKILVEMSDNQFILKAYDKWKEKCVCHLIGDFSFAIWDENERLYFVLEIMWEQDRFIILHILTFLLLLQILKVF